MKSFAHVGQRPDRYGRRHMTEAECDETIRSYSAGTTRDALADRYDRDRRTIDRLLKRRDALRGAGR